MSLVDLSKFWVCLELLYELEENISMLWDDTRVGKFTALSGVLKPAWNYLSQIPKCHQAETLREKVSMKFQGLSKSYMKQVNCYSFTNWYLNHQHQNYWVAYLLFSSTHTLSWIKETTFYKHDEWLLCTFKIRTVGLLIGHLEDIFKNMNI